MFCLLLSTSIHRINSNFENCKDVVIVSLVFVLLRQVYKIFLYTLRKMSGRIKQFFYFVYFVTECKETCIGAFLVTFQTFFQKICEIKLPTSFFKIIFQTNILNNL